MIASSVDDNDTDDDDYDDDDLEILSIGMWRKNRLEKEYITVT